MKYIKLPICFSFRGYPTIMISRFPDFFKGGGYRPLRPVQTTLAPGIVWDEFWMEKRL